MKKKEKYTKVFQDAFNISKEKAIKLSIKVLKDGIVLDTCN